MDVLSADFARLALAGSVTGDAMPDPLEAAETLDVEVAGRLALHIRNVRPARGPSSATGRHPENTADGGRRHAGFHGDEFAGQARAAFPVARLRGLVTFHLGPQLRFPPD